MIKEGFRLFVCFFVFFEKAKIIGPLWVTSFCNLLYMLAICRSLVGFPSHSLNWFVRLKFQCDISSYGIKHLDQFFFLKQVFVSFFVCFCFLFLFLFCFCVCFCLFLFFFIMQHILSYVIVSFIYSFFRLLIRLFIY